MAFYGYAYHYNNGKAEFHMSMPQCLWWRNKDMLRDSQVLSRPRPKWSSFREEIGRSLSRLILLVRSLPEVIDGFR